MTRAIAILVGAAAGAGLLHLLGFFLLRLRVRPPERVLARSVVENLRAPARFIVPLIGLEIATAAVGLRDSLASDLLHAFTVALIGACGFLAVRVTYILDDVVIDRFRTDSVDNLRARQIHTQIQVLRRITVVVVTVLSVSIALLTFPAVRAAGAGLLASAGIIGLVVGIAARPLATNVLAGLQIAISQPIRVDDVVVVEGEWGRIEQIALTYVVVRVWDLRRLVVPIAYFIENPFENWTRRTAEILGWVYLEVDYTAPIEALRTKLQEVLEASASWDGQVSVLQVTNAGPTTLQLRALMSSPDSSASWNLQCEVREKLIAYLQAEHPGALPRQRTELVDAGGDDSLPSMAARPDGQSPIPSALQFDDSP